MYVQKPEAKANADQEEKDRARHPDFGCALF